MIEEDQIPAQFAHASIQQTTFEQGKGNGELKGKQRMNRALGSLLSSWVEQRTELMGQEQSTELISRA